MRGDEEKKKNDSNTVLLLLFKQVIKQSKYFKCITSRSENFIKKQKKKKNLVKTHFYRFYF